jgi:hypothetical protein
LAAYNANTALYSIAPGDSIQVWNAEQPAAGNGGASASQQIAAVYAQGLANGISFKGFFSGAPGAFEIDVQASDVDADAQYQTLPNGNITTVDSTNQTFLFEDPNANHKFYRALMRSRANAVNVTGNFKR